MIIPKGAKVKKIKPEPVSPVEEAGMIEFLVNVTQSDIRLGIQGEPKTCAIARALAREFDEDDVSVEPGEIQIDGFETRSVPVVAKQFINRFDDDKKSVKPFSFILKLFRKD